MSEDSPSRTVMYSETMANLTGIALPPLMKQPLTPSMMCFDTTALSWSLNSSSVSRMPERPSVIELMAAVASPLASIILVTMSPAPL